MSTQDPIRLKVPHQDIDRCRFFDSDPESASSWLDSLPMGNLGSTTRQLYQAVTELNRVRMLPGKRLALLELLRTPVYYVTRQLSRHYLNQPAVLPDQARKVADLAHALHLQLATGYTIVATHTSALGKRAGAGKPERLIAQALHRATTDHTLNILRHCQLYEPVEPGVWNKLHQFYSLARQHKLKDQMVVDSEFGACTIEHCYIRALLIGCCNPNQLRQEDFMGIFSPLTKWASLCDLSGEQPTLFVVDPKDDKPAVYRQLYESMLQANWLNLDTKELVEHLQTIKQNTDTHSIKVREDKFVISTDLLSHLIVSWSVMSKRMFMRMESQDHLELCLGLSATHHFISGEMAFESLVQDKGTSTYTMQLENPFLKVKSQPKRPKDVWDGPKEKNIVNAEIALDSIEFDIEENAKKQALAKPDKCKYYYYRVTMINSSAHGYCVEWPKEVKAQLKTGEIIGIRDTMSHNWSIACIRWVSHSDDHTQLGLELISPSAAPYGGRIIQKTGSQSEYVRVLILPEISALSQPATLLTPRVPFKEGNKVIINQQGQEVQVQLTRKINQTGAYNQFEFRRTASYAKTAESDDGLEEKNNEFDSLWGSL